MSFEGWPIRSLLSKKGINDQENFAEYFDDFKDNQLNVAIEIKYQAGKAGWIDILDCSLVVGFETSNVMQSSFLDM